jgi:DeoR/GlpR family transcriptional regulator of sugar metabolism
MALATHSVALNVQPRQRRIVYDGLAKAPEGLSVKDLMGMFDIPERDLRETLRKLDDAGLAQRVKGVWKAVAIEPADGVPDAGEAVADGRQDA